MSLFKELKRRNVIRVAAAYLIIGWLLAQVSTTLEDALNLPPWFDTLIVTVMLIGFPLALIIAWVYELTPQGIKKEKDIKAQDSITLHTGKKLDYITIVAALAVVGLFVWQQMNPKQQGSRLRGNNNILTSSAIPMKAEIQPNSIAVLPFIDLSPNKDQEYFSDGMAEEILNVLVRVDALKVTSRTSAFQFKGQELGIPEIAKKLKVRYVLEGSVRKAGEKLRITAQLIDSQNDKHLWSDAFDRALTTENIFAIQDEISNAIVKALKKELGLEATEFIAIKKSTENLTAYELFLQARPLFQARKKLDKADELLIKAIALDPKFAQAWAMRAALQSLMFEYGFSTTPEDQNDKKGIEYANIALSIEPNTALALAVKSKIRLNANETLRGHFDYNEILKDYKKALVIDPRNPSTLNWMGLAYQVIGYQKKALEHFARCKEYEPRFTPCVANYIGTNQISGNYQIAVNQYLMNLKNGVLDMRDAPFKALVESNNELAFVLGLNSPDLFNGWHRNGEIYQAYKNPQLDHTELTKAAYKYLSDESKKLYYWQSVLTPLGSVGPPNDEYIDVFGSKHKDINHPKIKSYLKKAGIYTYWQENGYPPQCRPIGEDDFECD